ncbi:MAG TPA: SRPBCC domain-containing protein [Candidatus Acidoferrum sp.]|nr:SRPBCC domain-containing protein [Candidatus Acidoferrum sp.]
MTNQSVSKDFDHKQLVIKRRFDGKLARVWQCWTQRELLDRWWGPRQWPCTTKAMDFRAGGHWHYCLTGPDGMKAWCWVDYLKIAVQQCFTALDAFCDEQGVKNGQLPSTQWRVEFTADGAATQVTTTLTFQSVQDMETLIKMGFEAGFTDQLGRLDELLLQ